MREFKEFLKDKKKEQSEIRKPQDVPDGLLDAAEKMYDKMKESMEDKKYIERLKEEFESGISTLGIRDGFYLIILLAIVYLQRLRSKKAGRY